jgi:hypothetical protein
MERFRIITGMIRAQAKKINGNLLFCRQARAADPFYPGAEKTVGHDPPVKPGGTLQEADRRGQQKGVAGSTGMTMPTTPRATKINPAITNNTLETLMPPPTVK